MQHKTRDEKFTGLYVVPLIIAIDQQIDAGVLVLPDQVNGLFSILKRGIYGVYSTSANIT